MEDYKKHPEAMSERRRKGMDSYHAHSKHNPKTGFSELSKDAPKKAHNYYDSLGKAKAKSSALKKAKK